MSILSTFLVINSKNRTSDSKSSSDFQYFIGQSIEVQSIVLKSASIPNTVYNITSLNNIFEADINGAITTITLTPGFYSVLQISTILIARFLIAGSVLTITQDPNTNLLTFVSNVTFKILSTSNSLALTLGYIYDVSIPSATSVTFTYLPKLSGPLNFYILSKTLGIGSNGRFANGTQDAFLTSIPNNVQYLDINHYEPHIVDTNMIAYKTSINSQYIDITITDANLVPIDLHGSDIELVFKLYIDVQGNR